MAIIPQEYFIVACDGCGHIGENQAWDTTGAALEDARDNDWVITATRHLCPDCGIYGPVKPERGH